MKLPLTFDPDLEHIKDADGNVVCHFGPSDFGWSNDAVHAAEIVAACNSRESLLAVAERLDAWSRFGRDLADLNPVIHEAREALAAIKK